MAKAEKEMRWGKMKKIIIVIISLMMVVVISGMGSKTEAEEMGNTVNVETGLKPVSDTAGAGLKPAAEPVNKDILEVPEEIGADGIKTITVNLEAQPIERYEKKELCIIQREENKDDPIVSFTVDENENLFFLHERGTVKIFDKKGKFLNKVTFKKPLNHRFDIKVNNKGDILYYSRDGHEIAQIYKKEDKKIVEIKTGSMSLKKPKFVDTGIYSEMNGEIIYSSNKKIQLSKDRLYINDFEKKTNIKEKFVIIKNKNNKKLKLPLNINKYRFKEIIKIDRNKNIYIRYSTPPIMIGDNKYVGPMEQNHKIVKIDLSGKLLSVFDFIIDEINEETESIYRIEREWKENIINDHIIKWEKIK